MRVHRGKEGVKDGGREGMRRNERSMGGEGEARIRTTQYTFGTWSNP